MLSLSNDIGVTDHQLHSICYLAQQLNPCEAAIMGPSLKQIEDAEEQLSSWKKEVKIANSISTLLSNLKEALDSEGYKQFTSDEPEHLQVAAGFALARISKLDEELDDIPNCLPKASKQKLRNSHQELSKHLNDIESTFMEIRQAILFARGEGTEFRASKGNLLRLVSSANNTNTDGCFEFKEV